MFRSFLSWRYLTARRTNLIGIGGIFIGVFALILILSIMTGFLDESKKAIRRSLSDIIITPAKLDPTVPSDAEPLLSKVRAHPGVAAAAPHLNWFALITLPGNTADAFSERFLSSSEHSETAGVQLVGVDVHTDKRIAAAAACVVPRLFGLDLRPPRIQDEFDTSELLAALSRESKVGAQVANPLFPFAQPPMASTRERPLPAVVLGEQLLYRLNLGRGSQIQLSTGVRDPEAKEWVFNNRRFVVAGSFRSTENDMDLGRIYMEREELADFLGGTQQYSEVLVRLEDYDEDGERICEELRTELAEAGLIAGGYYRAGEVRTWEQYRGNILGAIKNERVLMMIMLSLVLLVAGFTVFAILSMMVTEKRRDIGILAAIGATPKGVLDLFLMIAFWDALIGAALGAIFGTWAALKIDPIERWLSSHLNFWPFPEEGVQIFDRNVYLFDYIPTIVQPYAVAAIVLGAFFCALLFAAIPAFRAARMDPLEALRYE